MIKVIMFDFDGTLADTSEVFVEAANNLSSKYGYSKISSISVVKDKDILSFLMQNFKVPVVMVGEYVKEFLDCIQKNIQKVSLFEGMKEVLEELHRDYKIIIISSNSENNIRYVLDKSKVNSVDTIYSASALGKKDEIFDKMIRENSLTKEELVYVGDEILDLRACEKYGIKFLGVAWGLNSEKALKMAGADSIASKPEDILKYFKIQN